MDERLAQAIGARVRSVRVAKFQPQVVVAGLAGIAPDYLYQIERGKKLPTLPVLTQLAEALRVPVSALVGEAGDRPGQRGAGPDPGEALYRALTRPMASHEPLSPAELHDHVRSAWRIWQTSPYRYTTLSRQLPMLVSSVEMAERRHSSDCDLEKRRQVRRCAADLYCLLRTVTKRVGRIDLSLLVADRAIRAAEAADDPLRLAASRWNLAHVLLADQEAEGAESVAMQAAGELAPLISAGDIDAVALSGALTLLSAVAAARYGKPWTARKRLRDLVVIADRTGGRNVCWTAFGPTNVAMHAVSVEIEAGEALEGLRLADQVDYRHSPSIERRVAFLLDQAKGYAQRRELDGTLAMLRIASQQAPEDIANRPGARQLLNDLIQRGRQGIAADAMRIAQSVGLAVG